MTKIDKRISKNNTNNLIEFWIGFKDTLDELKYTNREVIESWQQFHDMHPDFHLPQNENITKGE